LRHLESFSHDMHGSPNIRRRSSGKFCHRVSGKTSLNDAMLEKLGTLMGSGGRLRTPNEGPIKWDAKSNNANLQFLTEKPLDSFQRNCNPSGLMLCVRLSVTIKVPPTHTHFYVHATKRTSDCRI
jgi:hypothetical protein